MKGFPIQQIFKAKRTSTASAEHPSDRSALAVQSWTALWETASRSLRLAKPVQYLDTVLLNAGVIAAAFGIIYYQPTLVNLPALIELYAALILGMAIGGWLLLKESRLAQSDSKQHREADGKQKEALMLYKRAVDSSSDAIAIADPTGELVYQNLAFTQLYACETVEQFNQTGGIAACFADAEVAQAVISAITSGEDWVGETLNLSRRQRFFPAFIRANGIKDESGKLLGLIGTITDITERKRLEQELALQQARFNAFFSSANAGLVIVDTQLRHVHLNQVLADVNGLSIEDHLGKTLTEILPDVAVAVEPIYREVIKTGKPLLNQEVSGATLNAPDVVRHWFNSYFPLFDQAGNTIGAGAVIVDITDRKQAEEALRQKAQQEQLLNQLASQIRSSLDLDQILETVVCSIRDLLEIDRCSFIWYRPHATPPTWEATHEAKLIELPSTLGVYPSSQIGAAAAALLKLEILRDDDVQSIADPTWRQLLLDLGFKSAINIPILTSSGDMGVIACAHQSGLRPWKDSEVELLKSVANQIAIALNQADLYKRSRLAAQTAQAQARQLEHTLEELRHTQAQLVQTEKMSSLGQLVAGVAHEINNPVNFIHGNLAYAGEYTQDLLRLVTLYQQHYPIHPAIQAEIEAVDFDFLQEDLPKLLKSMQVGTDRIREIVLALRNFSRMDEAEMKTVDIHEGIDSTLMILQHRLKQSAEQIEIQVIKDYGNLPQVECYTGQLNQVFMNILSNAIDALDDYNAKRSPEAVQSPSQITIRTEQVNDRVRICIRDNGPGMSEQTRRRLFEPFFTTKPIGKGTGLGLSISYQVVVDRHGGELNCISALGAGAAFLIELPLIQSATRT